MDNPQTAESTHG